MSPEGVWTSLLFMDLVQLFPLPSCQEDAQTSELDRSWILEADTLWLTNIEVENYLFLEEPHLPSSNFPFPC